MLRTFVIVIGLVGVVATSTVAQPAPDPAIAPDAYARIERLVLEQRVLALRRELLERDHAALGRDLQEKVRELEAAIAEEAGRAKVEKGLRPDLNTKTWRKP